MPSEAEVLKDGINLSDMNVKLLQKIEELTLYVIEINKKVNELQVNNKKFEEENGILKSRIKEIEIK
jgi:hypothetical protein